MANEFIIKKGLISKADSIISGSLIVTEGVSGSFSGSFEGDGSGLTNVTASFSPTSSYALTASYVETAQNAISSSYALTASYAVSASHEIIKEVSSSYADTASFAQSGDGIFSGSFSGSYVGNGSGLTNLTIVTNRFGISNGSGSFTYYSDLSSSAAATVSGDVIQMFADFEETLDVNVEIKDGVTLDGNGYTYTLNTAGTSTALTFTSVASTTHYLTNIRIVRTGGILSSTTSGCILIGASNFNKKLYGDGVRLENSSGTCLIATGAGSKFDEVTGITGTGVQGAYWTYGRLKKCDFRGTTSYGIQIRNGAEAIECKGESTSSWGIYFNAGLPTSTNCIGISDSSYGIYSSVDLRDSTGETSTGIAGIIIASTITLTNCTGRAGTGAGIYTDSSSEILDCTGISVSGPGIYLRNNNQGTAHNCVAYSSTSTVGALRFLNGGTITNSSIFHEGTAGGNQHAIYTSGNSQPITIIGCDIIANDSTSNSIFAVTAGTNILLQNNVYEGVTTPLSVNVVQAAVNVADIYGNTHITSSSPYNYDFTEATAVSASLFSGSFIGDGSGITGVISASYAVSASHEIIKEVSSSYADTASFAQSGDGIFSGSFSGSFEGYGGDLTGISFSTDLTQSIFVTQNGNDSTAVIGNLLRPFATLESASLAATTGSTIFVYPGLYTVEANFNLAKPGVDYYFHPNTTVSKSTAGDMFDISGFTDTGMNVWGHADFILGSSAGSLMNSINVSGPTFDYTFQCRDIFSDSTTTIVDYFAPDDYSINWEFRNMSASAGSAFGQSNVYSDGLVNITCDEIISYGNCIGTGNGFKGGQIRANKLTSTTTFAITYYFGSHLTLLVDDAVGVGGDVGTLAYRFTSGGNIDIIGETSGIQFGLNGGANPYNSTCNQVGRCNHLAAEGMGGQYNGNSVAYAVMDGTGTLSFNWIDTGATGVAGYIRQSNGIINANIIRGQTYANEITITGGTFIGDGKYSSLFPYRDITISGGTFIWKGIYDAYVGSTNYGSIRHVIEQTGGVVKIEGTINMDGANFTTGLPSKIVKYDGGKLILDGATLTTVDTTQPTPAIFPDQDRDIYIYSGGVNYNQTGSNALINASGSGFTLTNVLGGMIIEDSSVE